MKISECYQTAKPAISFELFPPKTEEGEKKLYETVAQLKTLDPAFVSVTYGAMGTTRVNTLRIVSAIKNKIGLETAAHLTCVGHSQDEIEKILEELKENHIENIMALRGDPPEGEKEYKSVQNGFRYASELVRFIRRHPVYGKVFSLAVAGYPEGHLECRDKKKDLEHLKKKVDEGADVIITQLFFQNRDYFDFVERSRSVGIHIPIVPGIMPVTHGPQIEKFASMCGSAIPAVMKEAILKFGEDQTAIEAFGIDYATRQCEELLNHQVPGLHFYTLNKSWSTQKITRNLGLGR
ncbi:MAG: methylenetetrahydrofolate reductase [NAD(P)H] [Candidatus Omnitrophica bacterium]|nr:methylenetetrahydrofolate reductase [NAD(P)H] [Candidatus Omnitrophota bacterium]